MIRRVRLVPALLLLSACGGAAATAADTAVRRDSAGLEIVENGATDRPLGWEFVEVASFGGGVDDTLDLGAVAGIDAAIDARDQVFLAIGGWPDRVVMRLDMVTGSLRPIGRKGGGPGEYQMVGDLTASRSGELTLMDYGKQAFVRFGPDGQALPEASWTGFTDRGRPVAIGDANGALALHLTWYSDTATWRRVAVATATDTTMLVESTEPRGEMITFPACGISFAMPPLFSPGVVWGSGNGMVAAGLDSSYSLVVTQGTDPVRVVRRPFAPERATEAVAIEDLGEGTKVGVPGRPVCTISPEEVVRERGMADFLPVIRRVTFGPDGALWVERWAPRGRDPVTDIFDATGAYLGSLTGSHPWPIGFFANGDLLAAESDSLELTRLVRYRVTRTPG